MHSVLGFAPLRSFIVSRFGNLDCALGHRALSQSCKVKLQEGTVVIVLYGTYTRTVGVSLSEWYFVCGGVGDGNRGGGTNRWRGSDGGTFFLKDIFGSIVIE